MKLPANLVKRARKASLDFMPDEVTILAPGEPAADGRGGETVTYTPGETIACRWRPAKGRLDELVASRAQNREVFEFTMPYDAPVTALSRLRQGGLDYEIVGTVSANSFDIVQRVLACKVAA